MVEERRKYIRVQAPITVTYKLSGKKIVTHKTVTKDFSEGGIRIPVYEKLKAGTPLKLHIEIPSDTIPVFAQGEVVWIKALSTKEGREIYDAGVKFTQMQASDKERMAQTSKDFLSMGKKYRAG